MQTELIRSSVSKKSRANPSHISVSPLIQCRGVQSVSIHFFPYPTPSSSSSPQFPIFNILQSNLSPLTSDQWHLISNLYQTYEKDSGLLLAERYMYEQTFLPYKLRFKCSSMIDMMHHVFNGSSFFYKTNADFLSLPSNDRSILFEHSIGYLSSFSSNFIFHKIGLISQPTYYDAVSIMTHPDLIPLIKSLEHRLNIDMITMKLFLAILLFSIGSHFSSSSSALNFIDAQQIVKIQDKYTELTWRYLLSKYNSERAVMIFSDFLRSILKICEMIVHMSDMDWYRTTIDNLRQQIEQNLVF